ncbi:hypothetical protein IU436_16615 [Nocardia farcinica]|uniref:hypothetical protein n=1 Tax=Nocardia farcinica TaxID=37329 RepID=UPI001894703E|nr:hypothetical protein [Nocardia farcinica]MBF6420739.1 hypothetical protein [Nocardia farcinica]MBF6431983.1 hypothetical protein [Nocardia farcinica]MBF6502693.1 hypothetical protein [Nocardia farcinica]
MRSRTESVVLSTAAFLACAALTTGCGTDHSRAEPNCPTTFGFASSPAPLGDGAELSNAARTAARGSDPVTMQDLTSAAGLTDEWDRMVVVFPGTSEATLNSDAGTTGVCWANLPGAYGDDTPHTAYYLFVAGGQPVQAIHWFYPSDRALDFLRPRRSVIHPSTLLTPVHTAGAEPLLRPSTE